MCRSTGRTTRDTTTTHSCRRRRCLAVVRRQRDRAQPDARQQDRLQGDGPEAGARQVDALEGEGVVRHVERQRSREMSSRVMDCNGTPAKSLPARSASQPPASSSGISESGIERRPMERRPMERSPIERSPMDRSPIERRPLAFTSMERNPAATGSLGTPGSIERRPMSSSVMLRRPMLRRPMLRRPMALMVPSVVRRGPLGKLAGDLVARHGHGSDLDGVGLAQEAVAARVDRQADADLQLTTLEGAEFTSGADGRGLPR